MLHNAYVSHAWTRKVRNGVNVPVVELAMTLTFIILHMGLTVLLFETNTRDSTCFVSAVQRRGLASSARNLFPSWLPDLSPSIVCLVVSLWMRVSFATRSRKICVDVKAVLPVSLTRLGGAVGHM